MGELRLNPTKTYATSANARKAVEKSGDQEIKHMIISDESGRWYPIFIPSEDEMSSTGVHWRWCVVAVRR